MIMEHSAQRSEPVRTHIEAAGERLAYYRSGQGPDVVFLHGWPLHAGTFRDVARALSSTYTCHLFDLPGAGHSERHAGLAPGFRPLIGVARAAIDALQLSRFALVAHDSGGILARHLAADDARVVGLVLGDTELPDHQPANLRALHLLSRLPFGPALLRMSWRIGVLRRSNSCGFGEAFVDSAGRDRDFFERYLRPITASNASMAQALSPIVDYGPELLQELHAVHQRIRAPVQLIWGSADRVFRLEGARRMQAQFAGGAELATIEGGKLFAHEEFPEEFAARTRAFLQRVL
jgi:pimeloyl-ACP methyl ester carboxylesterase